MHTHHVQHYHQKDALLVRHHLNVKVTKPKTLLIKKYQSRTKIRNVVDPKRTLQDEEHLFSDKDNAVPT